MIGRPYSAWQQEFTTRAPRKRSTIRHWVKVPQFMASQILRSPLPVAAQSGLPQIPISASYRSSADMAPDGLDESRMGSVDVSLSHCLEWQTEPDGEHPLSSPKPKYMKAKRGMQTLSRKPPPAVGSVSLPDMGCLDTWTQKANMSRSSFRFSLRL